MLCFSHRVFSVADHIVYKMEADFAVIESIFPATMGIFNASESGLSLAEKMVGAASGNFWIKREPPNSRAFAIAGFASAPNSGAVPGMAW